MVLNLFLGEVLTPTGEIWADLREDKMLNPAPGFVPIFGPLGPAADPGALGWAPARNMVQVAPKISPGDKL